MIGRERRGAVQRHHGNHILRQQMLAHELDGAVERVRRSWIRPKPSTITNVRRVAGVRPLSRALAMAIDGSTTGPGDSICGKNVTISRGRPFSNTVKSAFVSPVTGLPC